MDQDRSAEVVREALRELRLLKQQVAGQRAPAAVVGVSVRLPGGLTTLDATWDRLASGEPVWGPPPASRRDDGVPDAVAGWLDDVAGVDLDRLGLPADAARLTDPQGRLLLEGAATVLAQAGVAEGEGRCAVVVGHDQTGWEARTLRGGHLGHPHASLGSFGGALATRIAHRFDLRGPALTVDASCAGGLSAAHLALGLLRARQCDLALVGAASVLVDPVLHAHYAALGLLDDQLRPLASDGAGYVRAEGCVVLLLQRLDDAVAQGRPVLGVLEGSAVAGPGRTVALGAPSARQHAEVAAAALQDAGVDVDAVGALEVHGIGSAVADALELQGLGEAYGARGAPLPVGATKGVLGHTEAASGLVGLVAALLMVSRGRALPTPVPERPLDVLGTHWTLRRDALLAPEARVAVHAYGMTGQAAHAVVAPAPASAPRGDWDPLPWARTRCWPEEGAPPSREDPEGLLRGWLAEILGDGRALAADVPLAWQGVDSIALTALQARMTRELGVDRARFDAARAWDLRGLAALVRAEEEAAEAGAVVPLVAAGLVAGLALLVASWLGLLGA
ncbi:MAG: hypothetical protein H6732_08045 [Alphaproteobacteria bacterium]|nr:hypothetical protein [Alphaproteobacteria bacterium]